MSEHISDLEDLVRQWANALSTRFGTTCKWVDLHATNPDMAGYQRYKLGIQVINVHYGGDVALNEMPDYIAEDTTINDTSLSTKSIFRHTKETTSSFTWTLKNTIRTGKDVKFVVAIPPIISSPVTSTEISTETILTKTETTVETWSVERHVTVPPQTMTEMIWTVKEKECSGTFYATVILTGYVAAWNEDAIDINDADGDDVHYLWFTPISKVFDQMQEWGISFPSQYTNGPGAVLYKVTGGFEGISGYDTSFVVNEKPLNATKSTLQCRCINVENISAY